MSDEIDSTEVPSARTSVAASVARAATCPSCGATRIWDDEFCEDCGRSFADDVADDAADEVAVWVAVVRADRELFGRGDWPGVDFPEQTTPQQITLSGQELRIGRGGLPTGDLEIELDDPAVSRLHGLLVRQADGSYSVVDRGSTNGTTLNDDDTPLTPNVAVSLGDGDRIHVGAWTTISLVRRSGDGGQPGNAPPPNP